VSATMVALGGKFARSLHSIRVSDKVKHGRTSNLANR